MTASWFLSDWIHFMTLPPASSPQISQSFLHDFNVKGQFYYRQFVAKIVAITAQIPQFSLPFQRYGRALHVCIVLRN